MKYLFILLLLSSCSYKVTNPEGYKIAVVEHRKLIENKATLYGQNHFLKFSFASNNAYGLYPKIYIHGAAYIYRIVDVHKHQVHYIRKNEPYGMVVMFKKPGHAILMLIWENKYYNTEPVIINLRYYGD